MCHSLAIRSSVLDAGQCTSHGMATFRWASGDTQVLVGLQAELPLRMSQAVAGPLGRVAVPLGPVHGLQQQPWEAQPFEVLGRGAPPGGRPA